MRLVLLFVVALAIVVGGGLALVHFVFTEESVRTHAVAGTVRQIVVRDGSGNVRLVPSGRRVSVRETRHYVFSKPTYRQRVKDGVLTIDSDCDGFAFECSADLRVTVPSGIDVVVAADSGDVHADRIAVRSAHLQSGSGNVGVALTGRQRLVWAYTDSGDVRVDAANAAAIEGRTSSGDVSIDAAGGGLRRVVAVTNSGDVDVAVPGGDWALDTSTGSGHVDVHGIGRDDHAPRSIDAKTDSGDVTVRAR
ncbi:MAG TPA: DUF4097 family beta strand repeat-containing protein [Solirubrobacteraceae bacterium]|jgi:hypothetical protein|nr:DUF4097 family beta strand repeat-containing protein [Solirubrobacteraceae bacterium]